MLKKIQIAGLVLASALPMTAEAGGRCRCGRVPLSYRPPGPICAPPMPVCNPCGPVCPPPVTMMPAPCGPCGGMAPMAPIMPMRPAAPCGPCGIGMQTSPMIGMQPMQFGGVAYQTAQYPTYSGEAMAWSQPGLAPIPETHAGLTPTPATSFAQNGASVPTPYPSAPQTASSGGQQQWTKVPPKSASSSAVELQSFEELGDYQYQPAPAPVQAEAPALIRPFAVPSAVSAWGARSNF